MADPARRESRCKHRLAAVASAVSLLLAAPSWATELVWSNGGADKVLSRAEPCTLLARFNVEEALGMVESRLVWVAEDPEPRTVGVVPAPGATPFADVCELRPDAGGALGARVDTAFHCATIGGGVRGSIHPRHPSARADPIRTADRPCDA